MFTFQPFITQMQPPSNEKPEIPPFKGNNILNRRTQSISICRQANKDALSDKIPKTKLDWYIWIEGSYSGGVFGTLSGI